MSTLVFQKLRGGKCWSDPGLQGASVLLLVYGATVARGLTLWDAGEFLAAIHALGIPHPPGTPLYVVSAHVWSFLTQSVWGFTLAVNLFSSVCMAAAFSILGHLLYRWTRNRLVSFAAVLCGGTMSTTWFSATETEVYASALLVGCLILWSANRVYETGEARWIVLTAYLCGLGWTLHLTALLTVPAALSLIVVARPVRIPWIYLLSVAVLGASFILYMWIRAQHDPAVNQGNPSTWIALWDVIERKQYSVAPLFPRQAPWWLQIGNIFQYADWQFALALYPEPGPAWSRTSITLLFALAGILGSLEHRAVHRLSWRVTLILLITGSLAVAAYLNLKAGPSFGYGILPESALREARERDYFFMLGFAIWGLWAAYGLITVGHRYGAVGRVVAFAIACAPIALNWSAIMQERGTTSQRVESDARALLDQVPERAIFLAYGDNDTYPLWYLQEVERFRRDVIVVTVPLLGPSWYREELARRFSLLTTASHRWLGLGPTLVELRAQAALQGRAVISSPVAARSPLNF